MRQSLPGGRHHRRLEAASRLPLERHLHAGGPPHLRHGQARHGGAATWPATTTNFCGATWTSCRPRSPATSKLPTNSSTRRADGRQLLVIHGDKFDGVSINMPWLAHFGDRAYAALLALNTGINWCRRKLGLKYRSYSQLMKQNVKRAVSYIHGFEEMMALHTRKRRCDGVVCGHIHTPAIKALQNSPTTTAATGSKAARPWSSTTTAASS